MEENRGRGAMGMISDETAYRQYLGGDEAAAAVLVERYGDALTCYLGGWVRDVQEAEDLMIEAFSRMFAKARPIGGDGSFRAYLYKTARSLALRHGQKNRLPFLRLEELPFELPGGAAADAALLCRERDRRLYAAMNALKPEYREALFLVYFEDLSYRDAAAVLGKNEQQITNLIHRGKQSLKTILEREGFSYADE